MKVLIMSLGLLAVVTAHEVLKITSVKTSYDIPPIKVNKRLDIPKHVLEKIAENFVGKTPRAQLTAQVNEYADLVLQNIGELIVQSGRDPLVLPDVYEGFEFTPIFITYHGELNMTNGLLYDIRTLHRTGDAILKYEFGLLNLQIPLGFDRLRFQYDYHADLMGLGPTGGVEGSVQDVEIFVDIMFDLYLMEIHLQEFRVDRAGTIDVNFTGNILIDWALEILVNVASAVLHGLIVNIAEGQVNDIFQEIIVILNEILNNLFTVPQI